MAGGGLYIDVIELREVRTGKILVEFFFLQVYGLVQKLAKKKTNIFPIRTEQHMSFIGDNARATIRRKKMFLLRHFRRTSAKSFGQTTKKLLNVKIVSFEFLFKNTNQ